MALFVHSLQLQLKVGFCEGGGGGELDDPEKNTRKEDIIIKIT